MACGRGLFTAKKLNSSVCLFGFFVPLENFSFIWRRHHFQRRVANFDLSSAHMVIEQ